MIRLENVCKNFGDLQVLKNVNLEVKEGEKLVIIGPSGSGKSTTVNVYQNVKFFCIVCCCQWLTNNNFQSLQSEVLVDVSFIDCDLTSSWYQVYSGDRFFLLPVP